MIFPSARTLCSVFLLGLISVSPINVFANPDGAGTCDVSGMAPSRHGPSSLSKAASQYTITSSQTSPGNYKLTLTGPQPIKGLLLYAVNGADKTTRIGQFSTPLPSGIVTKQCSGGAASTVNHNSPDNKPVPMTFQWSSGGMMQGTAIFKAIVVTDQAPGSWANVPDFAFNLANGTTATVNTTDSSNNDLSGTTTSSSSNQFFLVTFITTYPLFNVVTLITIFIYIVGSGVEYMLKRQQVNARRQAKLVGGYIRPE